MSYQVFQKTGWAFLMVFLMLILLAPVQGSAETPMRGGVLKTVIHGDPPSLDVHWTGADLVWTIGWHIFESVLTLDKNWNPIPMLADYRVDAGGKEIVLTIRDNVKFHNGKTMTSADVEASLKRWVGLSSLAKSAFKNLESIAAVDSKTVLIKLKQPSSTSILALAFQDQGPYVMPKEIIDAAGDGEVKEFIGTGPYQFVEWIPDRHIKLRRFEDYSALPGGSDGYGGTKHAYLDEIIFKPVSDRMTRVAGLIAGDFDYSSVPADQVPRLKKSPGVTVNAIRAGEMPCMVFNLKQGIMANPKMRQAVLASLNMSDIMLASMGDPLFYDLHSCWMPRGNAFWNEAGSELYNNPDADRAKKLLAEAGYQGEKIVWITTSTYAYMKDQAMVASSQLRKLGVNVDLQVVDWATLSEIRGKPEAYNIFSTGLTMKADPTMIAFMGTGWPGWYDTPRKRELVSRLKSEIDMQARVNAWFEMSKVIYEELPAIKFGEMKYSVAFRTKVQGLDLGPADFYWNTWLKK